jgi:hypothetical protein
VFTCFILTQYGVSVKSFVYEFEELTTTPYCVNNRRDSLKRRGKVMQDNNNVVNIQQAADILSKKFGRTISPYYIRQLRRYGKLKAINEPETEEEKGKTKAYLFRRSDVEQVEIGAPRVRGVRKSRSSRSSTEET